MKSFADTKIAVIGSTMMDLTVYADILPAGGETRFGESFTTGFGGKGANQAVMAARTGATVTMITGIGNKYDWSVILFCCWIYCFAHSKTLWLIK